MINNTMSFYKELQYEELKGEEFRYVNDCDNGYAISNLGRVRSVKRHIILKQNLKKTGYLHVQLSINGKSKTISAHRLVAISFIQNIDNCTSINHKDECKTNNIVDNLEWCSITYNNNYGNRIKKVVDKSAVTVVQLDVEGSYIKTWKNISEVGRIFDVAGATIVGCCKDDYKTACGYKWMYEKDYNKGKDITPITYHFQNKPFAQITLEGNLIREWYSLMQMHIELGYSISTISECLNKKQTKTHNFKWVYLTEYYENLDDDNKKYSNEIGHKHLMTIASTRKII